MIKVQDYFLPGAISHPQSARFDYSYIYTYHISQSISNKWAYENAILLEKWQCWYSAERETDKQIDRQTPKNCVLTVSAFPALAGASLFLTLPTTVLPIGYFLPLISQFHSDTYQMSVSQFLCGICVVVPGNPTHRWSCRIDPAHVCRW